MHFTLRNHLDTITPAPSLANSFAGKAALAVAATGLMAIAAHISLPLPFSPVPLTLQTFAVLLIGMTLGPTTAFAAMILYLAEGAAGLPVFSPHGLGGVAQILGPTGGFLLSYPFAAAAAGWLVRNLRLVRSSLIRALVAGVATSVIFFSFGATWLATLLHLHTGAAWHLAISPFLPGDVIKTVAAATLYSALHRTQQS